MAQVSSKLRIMPVTMYRSLLRPGRMDASQEQTDAVSFAVLEPAADGFRNYLKAQYDVSAEELLVDRATADANRSRDDVLVGGLRVFECQTLESPSTASSPVAETLTNDFFGIARHEHNMQVKAEDDGVSKVVIAQRAHSSGAAPAWT